MKIHAMRHGETPANAEKKIQGHGLDLGLNESGKDQVRKALEQLPAGITMIISSPLKRARESAEIVAAYLHLPITFLDELKEKDVGNLSGKTWDEASELSGRNLREEEREGTLGFQEFGGRIFRTDQNSLAQSPSWYQRSTSSRKNSSCNPRWYY